MYPLYYWFIGLVSTLLPALLMILGVWVLILLIQLGKRARLVLDLQVQEKEIRLKQLKENLYTNDSFKKDSSADPNSSKV